MPLIRQSIPAMYGGVSQQAPSIRATNQCEAAVNMLFSVAHGAASRPPVELLNLLTSYASGVGTLDPGDSFWEHIPYENHPGFLLQVPGNGTYKVFDLRTGNILTATGDTGQAYLTAPVGSKARDVFRIQTIGLRVLIVNTTVTAAMGANTAAGSLAGEAQTLQSTTLNGVADGTIWKIRGTDDNPNDTYYAKKVGTTFVEWVNPGILDTLDAATMPHQFLLVPDPVDPLDVSVQFGTYTWALRLVGDVKSNKEPSCVGRRISGIFFAHDRLWLLAGGSITGSETGEYGNLWRTTVVSILDSDRIDVTVASDGASDLHWGSPLVDQTMLLASQRQFALRGEPIMSPRTVSVTQATAYPVSTQCRPVNIGPNIYFASDSTRASQVYEMFIQEDSVTTDAANIAAHVPTYIDGKIRRLAASTNHDILVALVDGQDDLWVYSAYWAGDEKVQSAWGKWTIAGGVKPATVFCVGDFLYIVYYNDTGGLWRVFLGAVLLKPKGTSERTENETGFAPQMDHLMKVTGVYNAGENRTYFTSAFPVREAGIVAASRAVNSEGAEVGRVFRIDGNAGSGAIPTFAGATDFQFAFGGDLSAIPLFIGVTYESKITFSPQYYYDGERAVLNSRTQIRNMSVAFTDTAYFKTEVDLVGPPTQVNSVLPPLVSTYTSRTLGAETFSLNNPQIADGTYRFPILGKSNEVMISILKDEPTPMYLTSAEWEGLVTTRTRR